MKNIFVVVVYLFLTACSNMPFRANNLLIGDDSLSVGRVVGTVIINADSLDAGFLFKEVESNNVLEVRAGKKFLRDDDNRFIGKVFELTLKPGKYHFYRWYSKELVSIYYIRNTIEGDDVQKVTFEVKPNENIYIGQLYLDSGFLSKEQRNKYANEKIGFADSFKLSMQLVGGEFHFSGFSIEDKFEKDIDLISNVLDSKDTNYKNMSLKYNSDKYEEYF